MSTSKPLTLQICSLQADPSIVRLAISEKVDSILVSSDCDFQVLVGGVWLVWGFHVNFMYYGIHQDIRSESGRMLSDDKTRRYTHSASHSS